MLGLALLLICVCAATQPVFGSDYYVSASGNDTASGHSPDQAWRTIEKVNSVTFSSADRILFEGGQMFAGTLIFTAADRGTASEPITVSSYGMGRAIINAGQKGGLDVYNTAGFRIERISFVGDGPGGNTADGISFYMDLPGNVKLDTVTVNDVDVGGFGKSGISVGSWNGKSGYKNVRITYVDAHNNVDSGIVVWGFFSEQAMGYSHNDVYIGHSKAYNNGGKPGTATHSGDGIVISDVDGGVIERCVAYNNGSRNTAVGGPVGIWSWDSNNIVIQYNESHHNRTGSSADGGGFDLDGGVTNSVLQYNYSHDNDGSGYLIAQFRGARPLQRNVIRYNVSENDGRKNSYGAIMFWNGGSGVSDIDVYNNTIYVSPSATGVPTPVYFMSPVRNIRVWNNIFALRGGLDAVRIVPGQSGVVFERNAYWADGMPLSFRWANVEPDTGLQVDPRLVRPGSGGTLDNPDLLKTLIPYQLGADSPLIDAGLPSVSSLWPGGVDFFEQSIPQARTYDIGAHEFSSASAQTRQPIVFATANGASFGWSVSPGSWMSILGSDLSMGPGRLWRADDFVGGNPPTTLDGTSVTINGKAVPIAFVSPRQINALAPVDVVAGSVEVQVKTPLGTTHRAVAFRSLSPAFFVLPEAHGNYFVSAVAADGTVIGRRDAVPQSRPVRPGDAIMLYGTGFGPTQPGQAVLGPASPARLAGTVTVLVGNTHAIVEYAGLVSYGAYQLNIRIPDLPDGDHTIVAEIGGYRTQDRVILPVER